MSGKLFQRVVTALPNDLACACVLFAFSPNPHNLCLVCTGKRNGVGNLVFYAQSTEKRRERGGVYGKANYYTYCCAVSCRHWYVIDGILYPTRLEMGNQCRNRRTGVQRSREFIRSQYKQQQSGSFAGYLGD